MKSRAAVREKLPKRFSSKANTVCLMKSCRRSCFSSSKTYNLETKFRYVAQGFLPFSTYGIILVHSIYLSLLVFFQGNLLLAPFHLSFVSIAIIPPSYPCSLVTSSFHTFSLFTLTFSFPLFNNSPKPHKCIY